MLGGLPPRQVLQKFNGNCRKSGGLSIQVPVLPEIFLRLARRSLCKFPDSNASTGPHLSVVKKEGVVSFGSRRLSCFTGWFE
jgi:hypothetical protein